MPLLQRQIHNFLFLASGAPRGFKLPLMYWGPVLGYGLSTLRNMRQDASKAEIAYLRQDNSSQSNGMFQLTIRVKKMKAVECFLFRTFRASVLKSLLTRAYFSCFEGKLRADYAMYLEDTD